jgi:exopolysaccharide biosynthesis polyprenyl glycosylphosphotransferase
VYHRHHRKVRLLFALADVVLVTIAFEAAYQTRVRLPLENVFFLGVVAKALLVGAAAVLWPSIGYWLNLYDRLDSANPRVILRDTLKQSALGTVGVVLVEYALRLDLSRPFLGLFFVYSFTILGVCRWRAGAAMGWIRREFGALLHVLVVGTGDRARRLGEELERSAPHGTRLAGFLADSAGPHPPEMRLANVYPVHPLSELPSLLEKTIVDEVLFAIDGKRLAELEDVLLLCEEDGVRTRVAVDFFPHVNSEVYLDRLRHTPLLTFAAAPHDEVLLFLKRVIDVALASAALVVFSPLMLLVAALIRITSRGPAIFRQVRCGLNGRRFVVYKFRSMYENAEAMKDGLASRSRREIAFKIPDDPRRTPLGRLLRKLSIDEWPQLWNVIRGDMSLVGPRPPVPEEVDQYKRWQRRRLRMRPGLTCLWALEGRDELDFESWMRKDMEYIDNWSLALDWKIMLRTIPRVLGGRGAH